MNSDRIPKNNDSSKRVINLKRKYNKYNIRDVVLDTTVPYSPEKYFYPLQSRYERLKKQNWKGRFYNGYPYWPDVNKTHNLTQNNLRRYYFPQHSHPHSLQPSPQWMYTDFRPWINNETPPEIPPEIPPETDKRLREKFQSTNTNPYDIPLPIFLPLGEFKEDNYTINPIDAVINDIELIRASKRQNSKSDSELTNKNDEINNEINEERKKINRSNSLDDLMNGSGGMLFGFNDTAEVTGILEKIFKINKKCEEEIQKMDDTKKQLEEQKQIEFYNKDYDEIIEKEINGIDDLIELGDMYDVDSTKKYNINLKAMRDLSEPLKELRSMIGMESLKGNVVNLILYYLQDFEMDNKNMLHTVIEGPPGCGKTEVSQILSRIFLKMGVLKSDFFKVVKRSDLIGKYLGSTAVKTQGVIDEVKENGGVLFIDEAYSLGNDQQKDHFSSECINTLNQNLTEEKCNFICIIAGYRDELKSSFFAYNPGLERRFPFRFSIEPYTPEQLRQIYLRMVKKDGWRYEREEDIRNKFFEDNKQYFKYNGGDMETLFHFTKVVHARRVFCLPRDQKKCINRMDMERALEMFLRNDEVKNRGEDAPMTHMYL